MKTTDNHLYPAIRSFLCDYLVHRRNASKHTIRAYRHVLSEYVTFAARRRGVAIGQVDVGDFGSGTVLAYLESLENGGRCSVRTRNHRLNCIRSFLSHAADEDVSMQAICLEVRKIPLKKDKVIGEVRYMSEKAMTAILGVPSAKTRKGLRDLSILSALYDTGARRL